MTATGSGGRKRSRARVVLAAAAAGVMALAFVQTTAAEAASTGPSSQQVTSKVTAKVTQNPRGKFLGVVPNTVSIAKKGASTIASPPLLYHGGPVQHSSKAYAIYWAPPGYTIPPSYQAGINQYFTDVAHDSYGTKNVYAVGTQYYDTIGGTKNFESYNVTFGGSIVATNALPGNGCANYQLADGNITKNCLTDAQISTEINSVRSSLGLPQGLGTQYFLITPPRLGSCFTAAGTSCYDGASGGYCAYHSHSGSAATTTLYANQPFASLTGCDPGTYPNGSLADSVLNVISHEANETMTDPLGNAWFDSSGAENGDECNFAFITIGNNGWGNFTNVINGHQYNLQPEWSNRTNSCVNTNTFPQPTTPTVGINPATPVHGASATYTGNSTVSGDTITAYKWAFSDGTTATGKVVNHVFATAGAKTATLVVFDSHGDQARFVRSFTVS